MATITYTNNTPVAELPYNPGMDEVLDRDGPVTQATQNLYEITNKSGGSLDGFKFQLTSSANAGAGDFAYYLIVGGGPTTIPLAGKIDGITVRAPDGTIILQVTAGTSGFGDQDLVDFHSRLFGPNTAESSAIFLALTNLLGNDSVFQGSNLPDHMQAYGDYSELIGGGGDDVLWSPDTVYAARLVGGDGNDTIRVGDRSSYEVHGANADGSGGAGETNTLEIVGYAGKNTEASFEDITDIDVLRFTAATLPEGSSVDGGDIDVDFDVEDIGAGLVSLTLAVSGSTTASPFSDNDIYIHAKYDLAATSGVNLDLSSWTFRNWNQEHNSVNISTNYAAVALNDTIVGTRVADEIYTHDGNDSLRGGGGADWLGGGNGNDTFVYGRNEAVSGEHVDGGYDNMAGGIADTVLVLANNNFTGVEFWEIEQLKFGGKATATFDQNFIENTKAVVIGNANANTIAIQMTNPGSEPSSIDISDVKFKSWTNGVDKVTIIGTKSHDTISGTTRGDIINGAGGSDDLQGNQGADKFLFNTAFGKGVDHIADFLHKQGDRILLEKDIFTKLKLGTLASSAFTIGTKAKDGNDRVIYDEDNGVIRYDADGTGGIKGKIFAILDDAASLTAADFFVI